MPPGSPNPDPISDQKNAIFHNLSHPFSDQTSKIHTPFLDLAFRQKLCYHYLDKRANKKLFKSISNPHISLSFVYSFGIETMNKFTHSRSSLENHTQFQTKMRKVYTRFQTKTSQNPSPMAYTREFPPGAGTKCPFQRSPSR